MKKILILVLTVILFTSCFEKSNSATTSEAKTALTTEAVFSNSSVRSFSNIDRNAYGREQLVTEASQSNFNKVQPPVILTWSLEREQLNERNKRWNDRNKVSYIYLLSDMGTIVAYFPIKGKVSSVNSKLTTNQQVIKFWSNSATGTVESPSMDGSYGTNGDGVFFFLTDGTYVEWAGKYLLSDNYIKLTQKPVLTYDITPK